MPIPLIAAAQPAIASRLAQKGLDLLSGVFRGPPGQGAAEMAQLIHDQTGIDINDAAENKLGDAQWARLKQFEFDGQSKLLALRQQGDGDRIELERIAAADRANARQMQEAAMANQDPWVRRFIYVYASVITLLTFAFIFVAAFGPRYEANDPRSRVIDTVLGFLLGVSLSAIIQYFFGSSAGSKAKDDRIGDAMRAQTQALRADPSRDRGGRP
ncbi:hypothetical protein [Pelomonas aquatica]|jgi:hypothetical protein|uniref:Uncharacterized protein n=1 Tax=Pelomonas aquatica TaxID=431058 RepID=A0A9X4LK40_9BURK|nr:hypothetical protein [Pelomonas aquatica]MCY4752898.1 hypothetical protein [Pelomonas aquatica]MDG0864274.1 hypothetical protein [Pelomonas aquatica]